MVDVVGDPNVLEVCTVLFSSLAEVDVQVVQSYRRVAPELQRVKKSKSFSHRLFTLLRNRATVYDEQQRSCSQSFLPNTLLAFLFNVDVAEDVIERGG